MFESTACIETEAKIYKTQTSGLTLLYSIIFPWLSMSHSLLTSQTYHVSVIIHNWYCLLHCTWWQLKWVTTTHYQLLGVLELWWINRTKMFPVLRELTLPGRKQIINTQVHYEFSKYLKEIHYRDVVESNWGGGRGGLASTFESSRAFSRVDVVWMTGWIIRKPHPLWRPREREQTQKRKAVACFWNWKKCSPVLIIRAGWLGVGHGWTREKLRETCQKCGAPVTSYKEISCFVFVFFFCFTFF